jgi:Lar family restriction alleviation protein
MKEIELKPCPFCGGEAALMKRTECAGHGCYIPQVFVACKNCGAKGGKADAYFDDGDLESIAVERWNRRAYERKAD